MESHLLEVDDNLFKLLQTFETEHLFNPGVRICVGSAACAFSAVMADVVGFFSAEHCQVYRCLECIETEHLFKPAPWGCVRSSACAFSAVMTDENTRDVNLCSF